MKAREFPEPASSLTVTLLLGLLFGAITQKLGVHALFGFFLAGIVAGEAKSLSEDTRRVISQMVYSLFVPLFFRLLTRGQKGEAKPPEVAACRGGRGRSP